ncbi:MAG: SAM-dependent methyltransferase [Candidatus Micrarchaeota archaeon]
MAFLPFDRYQKRINSKYYSKKGSAIYGDFSTFALGNRIAQANAKEFHGFAKKRKGSLEVGEFGVGNGLFARRFLEEVERLDVERGTGCLKRIDYSLVDISRKMLMDAKMNLRGYDVNIVCSDALEFRPRKLFNYVRINELLSDLPSKLLFRKGKGIFELGLSGKKPALVRYAGGMPPGIGEFPEGYVFPMNTGAIGFLQGLKKVIAKGGYVDIFDYGFGSFGDVVEEPREVWNDNVSRWYGDQVTVDVNFPHLKSAFRTLKLETQKEYVERVLKERLFQVQMENRICYLNEAELAGAAKKLRRAGYSEEFIRGEFEEESDYWHVRIKY